MISGSKYYDKGFDVGRDEIAFLYLDMISEIT